MMYFVHLMRRVSGSGLSLLHKQASEITIELALFHQAPTLIAYNKKQETCLP